MITSQSSCTDINETGLIPVDTAKDNILSTISTVRGYQCLAIEQARGRTLYHDIISPCAVPPHSNSAVDGYALRATDLPAKEETRRLEITGTALAGKPYPGSCLPGQAVRIMTGAMIPARCDMVIMQEHVDLQDNYIVIDDRHVPGQNIRQAGEDIQQDQTVLRQGKYLTPADIGLLASLGIAEIEVRRKLSVAIASTGDEIVGLGESPGNNGIYDSNRYSLLAALDRADIEVINLGILQDRPEALLDSFTTAAQYADIIISTGGVSVGDADYTKTALKDSGTINFWKVAIKPGRPLAFGKIGNCAFFGLPGNPVAVLVTFYQFVLPALDKMLGVIDKPIAPVFTARTTQAIRKKPGRTEIQRGILQRHENGEWSVKTTGKQGSGILRSMSLANAFIILSHDSGAVEIGDPVTVQPFAGLF